MTSPDPATGAPGAIIRPLARRDYDEALQAMRAFTAARTEQTSDEIWLVEHPPVFTLGLAGRTQHVLASGDIPVVRTERGGQVTYHGPGQVVAYLLLDLRRRQLAVRELVRRIEQAVIDCLGGWGVAAVRRPGAPGVYVGDAAGEPAAKIASVGLKVSRGCSYHGVALNVAMDLEPFRRIDPCGYPGMQVTDLRSELAAMHAARGAVGSADAPQADPATVAPRFARALIDALAAPVVDAVAEPVVDAAGDSNAAAVAGQLGEPTSEPADTDASPAATHGIRRASR